MSVKRVRLECVLVGAAVLIGAAASTVRGESIDYDGQQLTAARLYDSTNATPTVDSSATITVGPGEENINGVNDNDVFDLDVSATNILISYDVGISWDEAPYNGFGVFDSGGDVAAITAVTINAITNVTGLDATRIAFDADNVYINWRDLDPQTGQVISLDVTFASPAAAPLPLAATSGMALMTSLMTRRRLAAR